VNRAHQIDINVYCPIYLMKKMRQARLRNIYNSLPPNRDPRNYCRV